MRTLNVNLKNDVIVYAAGRIGEHNATTLLITPPGDLAGESNFFRAAFEVGDTIKYSDALTGDSFKVKLWQELTQNRQLPMTLNGYLSDGTFIGKSAKITFYFKESLNEPPILEGESGGLFLEISKNSAARLSLEQKELLEALGDEGGELTFRGNSIGKEVANVSNLAEIASLPDSIKIAVMKLDAPDLEEIVGRDYIFAIFARDASNEFQIISDSAALYRIYDILIEMAENTAMRHEHPYPDTINAFSESGNTLLWKGQPIEGGGGSSPQIYDSYWDLPNDVPFGTQAFVKVFEDERLSDISHGTEYTTMYFKDDINGELLNWILNTSDEPSIFCFGDDVQIIFLGDKSFPFLPKYTLAILEKDSGLPIFFNFLVPTPKSHMGDVFYYSGMPLDSFVTPTAILFGWYSCELSFDGDVGSFILNPSPPPIISNFGELDLLNEDEEIFFKHFMSSSPWGGYEKRLVSMWCVVYTENGWMKV